MFFFLSVGVARWSGAAPRPLHSFVVCWCLFLLLLLLRFAFQSLPVTGSVRIKHGGAAAAAGCFRWLLREAIAASASPSPTDGRSDKQAILPWRAAVRITIVRGGRGQQN